MLPDLNTCRDRIGAYNQALGYGRQLRAVGKLPELQVGFVGFWNYKEGVEDGGNSILDDAHLPTTAAKLRLFLIDWGMRRTGIAGDQAIEGLLRNIRPHYHGLRDIVLGSGQIQNHRRDLEDLYKGLDGITNLSIARGERHHGESSITGKSKAIIAIWGQTPAFDRLTRKNLCQREWTHLPDSGQLPHLEHREE
jgi:hypothetical protein